MLKVSSGTSCKTTPAKKTVVVFYSKSGGVGEL